MAYKKAADGVASRGKTNVQVFPNSGPTAANLSGGKAGKGKKGGVTTDAMKAVGRNMARAKNQGGK